MASVLQDFDQYNTTDQSSVIDNIYQFTPKHQYSTKNNPLCGICLPQWIQILRQRHHQIEWRKYWPRLLLISCLSCVNSLLAIPEQLWYGKRLHEQPPSITRPVFVLGHPRTGTTLLHSLLALHMEQFAICTTFCAGFPSCFLWFEHWGKRLFANIMDETRPMDNMRLHFDLPQEDECATNVLSAGTSPYMALFFMHQEAEFQPYQAFHRDDDARQRWKSAFLGLCQKLMLRAQLRGGGYRLLLKSPVHTARIPLLLSLFPDAQFIYIHRHPYDVLRSALHMADTTYWYTYFHTPTHAQIQEFVLRQYEILWDEYVAGRALLSDKQLLQVSFQELTSHPVETLARIYQHFGWDGWEEELKPRVRREVQDLRSYEKNQHRPLHPALRKIVNERWKASFEDLGYEQTL